MISKKELNPHGYVLSPEQESNFEVLYRTMNIVRALYAKPMIVTSGVRSMEDQLRISPKHPHSAHTFAAACDIKALEADGEGLWIWCLENMDVIIQCELYLEDRKYTPNHIHFQVLAPKSRARIFTP